MTNGEKLQKIFSNLEYEILSRTVITNIDKGAWFSLEWWNAEYKEQTTKNDLGVDCISRQAVLELIADDDLSMGQVVRGIHALPPVTPQEPTDKIFTLADMVAMLTDLQLDVEGQKFDVHIDKDVWNDAIRVCSEIIQEKINELMGESEE